VRQTVIGDTSVTLKYFEEVFTSQHWMMRIYRVRDQPLRDKGSSSSKAKRKPVASSSI
jgi:dolichyl-diphosphooligosaccharide--protein glycosyltransferase